MKKYYRRIRRGMYRYKKQIIKFKQKQLTLQNLNANKELDYFQNFKSQN